MNTLVVVRIANCILSFCAQVLYFQCDDLLANDEQAAARGDTVIRCSSRTGSGRKGRRGTQELESLHSYIVDVVIEVVTVM